MKLYTLDNKLLTERPEIRIGDKVLPVDDREKTMRKILALQKEDAAAENFDWTDRALELALGKKGFAEIQKMDLPFPAYRQLLELVMDAITGQEARFPGEPEQQ